MKIFNQKNKGMNDEYLPLISFFSILLLGFSTWPIR